MKSNFRNLRRAAAFTLVEMIGVLAIIAILASMLVPRVFQAIGDSKINNAASTCIAVKAAVNEYYGKYGKIGGTNGVDLGLGTSWATYEDWDLRCLVTEGFMERPFSLRIGNGKLGQANGGSRLRVMNITGNTPDSRAADNATSIDHGAYNLDGASTTNDVIGALIIEACIEGVDNLDAIDLSGRIDGPALSVALGQNDEAGRVKYLLSTNGTASVRIYLAHH